MQEILCITSIVLKTFSSSSSFLIYTTVAFLNLSKRVLCENVAMIQSSTDSSAAAMYFRTVWKFKVNCLSFSRKPTEITNTVKRHTVQNFHDALNWEKLLNLLLHALTFKYIFLHPQNAKKTNFLFPLAANCFSHTSFQSRFNNSTGGNFIVVPAQSSLTFYHVSHMSS